jgi:ABC-type multidrug transport system permease subunit
MPLPLIIPAIVGGIGVLRGVMTMAKGTAELAILTAMLTVQIAQVISSYLAPVVFFLAKLALKMALLLATYVIFTTYVLGKIEPVFQAAASYVPSSVAVLARFFEFMQLTSATVPWELMGTLFKYIILLKMALLVWHLADWIFNQVRSWTGFVTQ